MYRKRKFQYKESIHRESVVFSIEALAALVVLFGRLDISVLELRVVDPNLLGVVNFGESRRFVHNHCLI